MTDRVVMFSGGVGSWAAAKRVAERHGTDSLYLLFTDTLIEDADLYRFLIQGAADVFGVASPEGIATGLPEFYESPDERPALLADLKRDAARVVPRLIWISDGRDPWTLFRQKRILGNSYVDVCSRVLKRERFAKWAEAGCDVDHAVMYVGIDWTERHRYDRMRDRWAKDGWAVEAPLCDPPLMDKTAVFALLESRGIVPPKLYGYGFAHNNCGGFCIKAGQGHYRLLLEKLPERYAFFEAKEEEIRRYLGRDVAILPDRIGGGPKRPLTLRRLRERIEAGGQVDEYEVGGCGCFVEDAEAEA